MAPEELPVLFSLPLHSIPACPQLKATELREIQRQLLLLHKDSDNRETNLSKLVQRKHRLWRTSSSL